MLAGFLQRAPPVMPGCHTNRSPNRRRRRAGTGFGLIEFLIALAIVAILSGVGAAGYRGVTGRTSVAVESGDLLHAIELTRSEAAKRGVRVTLLPVAGDWAAGWTVFVDTNGNRQVDAGEPLILAHARLRSSTRVVANTTPGYIAFGAAGTPQQYSGAFLAATLTLCDAGVSRSIVLARTGRPRTVPGNC
ncbi:MAG: GspH/FimT family pseudopilin [Betaproteobacteria bacterium]|nr:GspH/FimT family pseudopilin [Betaproteobacteria bacterium]